MRVRTGKDQARRSGIRRRDRSRDTALDRRTGVRLSREPAMIRVSDRGMGLELVPLLELALG
jgi:hypothetical protein